LYSPPLSNIHRFTPNPTYEEACSGQTGHTEGVRVVYNPEEVSFVDVLRWFWEAHDPASGMGQGNDRGTQYRSGFYFFDDEQKQLIEASKDAYEKRLEEKTGSFREITTEIAAASDYEKYGGVWNFAEAQ
jgi:peptide-methionine (S)-S-oxide reductase